MTGRTFYIKTYGCQMNVYDSTRMADLLAPQGYRPVAGPEAADLVVLNTCHIREKAAEKVYSELGRLRLLKTARAAAGEEMTITVAGCVAQAEGAEILRRAPQVDLVVGPQSYHRLPELLARRRCAAKPRLVETDFPPETKFDHLPESTQANGPGAFLAVQEGCDKFCSFCVVPYTRGAEYSRPAAEVIAEARRLAAGGAQEITLLGQNVNAYHGAGPDGATWGLARLLTALAAIEDIARLRYTTSHPADMDDALIALHGAEPKLMPYLHLPVQSGADSILAAMNRRHRVADYLRLVARLRAVRSDLALSSDFIVGFPGESESDFEATLALVREVGFAQAYSFKYSPRPGTPAAELADQVPEAVKRERLARLQALLDQQQQAFNAAQVGSLLPVLLDRPGRRGGQLVGRSPYMQAVVVEAPEAALGQLTEVRIRHAGPNSLEGERVVASGAIPADAVPALEVRP